MKHRVLIDDLKEFSFYFVVIIVTCIIPLYGFDKIWLTITGILVTYILLLPIYIFVILMVRHFRRSKAGGKGPEA